MPGSPSLCMARHRWTFFAWVTMGFVVRFPRVVGKDWDRSKSVRRLRYRLLGPLPFGGCWLQEGLLLPLSLACRVAVKAHLNFSACLHGLLTWSTLNPVAFLRGLRWGNLPGPAAEMLKSTHRFLLHTFAVSCIPSCCWLYARFFSNRPVEIQLNSGCGQLE